MITFVCWKWKRPRTGYQLPSAREYTAEHVNTLYSMLDRHMTESFRLLLLTDRRDEEIDEEIEVLQFDQWKHEELGGCYRRLIMFNDCMRHLLGQQWLMLDLDCVVSDDLVPLIKHLQLYDFAMNRYCLNNAKRQHYNGALQWHTAGARPEVCSKFLGKPTAKAIERDRQLVGTDQAWISHVLGPGEKTVGPEHGIYDISQVGNSPPPDTRIVFFHGARDPSVSQSEWVREYYR